MMTDIEIAQSTPLCPIAEIAAKAGIPATAAETHRSHKEPSMGCRTLRQQ